VVTTDVSDAQAGVLQGAPWIVTSEMVDSSAALLDAVDVGTDGVPPEAGLGAAVLALSEPLRSDQNRGFRREDASLHVVVVSDNDDSSEDVLGEDPGAVFLEFLEDEALATGGSAVLSAIVGDEPVGCVGKAGSALPGSSYIEVAESSGGTVGSVCDADLSAVVEGLGLASATWPDTFELQASPEADTVRVELDGLRQDDGWSLAEEPPAIIFDGPPEPSAEIEVRYQVAQ
jgi:hypothetical protein